VYSTRLVPWRLEIERSSNAVAMLLVHQAHRVGMGYRFDHHLTASGRLTEMGP